MRLIDEPSEVITCGLTNESGHWIVIFRIDQSHAAARSVADWSKDPECNFTVWHGARLVREIAAATYKRQKQIDAFRAKRRR